MQITIDLPDELIQHFNQDCLAHEIVEALVVQAYQAEKITTAEVGRILNLPSRWAVEAFLKQHNADLHYDEADLEHDRETLRQLRLKQNGSAS
jgi:predicted HTH domain antitoxin